MIWTFGFRKLARFRFSSILYDSRLVMIECELNGYIKQVKIGGGQTRNQFTPEMSNAHIRQI